MMKTLFKFVEHHEEIMHFTHVALELLHVVGF